MRDMFGIPHFDPVPSASTRHDGWTAARQRAFIRALARTGVISAAARAVGMSPKSVYALLKRAGPDSRFARIFDAAYALGRAIRHDARDCLPEKRAGASISSTSLPSPAAAKPGRATGATRGLGGWRKDATTGA